MQLLGRMLTGGELLACTWSPSVRLVLLGCFSHSRYAFKISKVHTMRLMQRDSLTSLLSETGLLCALPSQQSLPLLFLHCYFIIKHIIISSMTWLFFSVQWHIRYLIVMLFWVPFTDRDGHLWFVHISNGHISKTEENCLFSCKVPIV